MKSETDGPIRILTLDRPGKLNAMNSEAWTDLLRELRTAEDDPSIRVLLLRSQGRAFCAGNDIKETNAFTTRAQTRAYFLDLMVPTITAMAGSRLPIVAEVQGMALGAGMELLQFCDVVVASDAAVFRLPETSIGLWATVFLGSASYTTSRRMTQYLALTGEPVSAREALEAGLITRVVAPDDLQRVGGEVAARIARNAPRATALSKKFANHTMLTESLPVVREALSVLIDETFSGQEGMEGVASFLEKRAPVFADVTNVHGR
ncbi:enoyl-CoA hydratase/isomerase family protein [Streptomyces cathayae]|uniref:Enoyl-CoA hydratase/isomerase family protein n=1 Tax=Streptomyces cathayae TaxID=3031124 RepID=A0ABY8JZ63_9ACTN|nr:enoyl-CoA hydratase/isomerase family protein [Streptomyces sp. HUAS 5]WGD41071.1 enoyl-CoA hydratase/isomerase family protein [Streptomyces sp. HUAS 5]